MERARARKPAAWARGDRVVRAKAIVGRRVASEGDAGRGKSVYRRLEDMAIVVDEGVGGARGQGARLATIAAICDLVSPAPGSNDR